MITQGQKQSSIGSKLEQTLQKFEGDNHYDDEFGDTLLPMPDLSMDLQLNSYASIMKGPGDKKQSLLKDTQRLPSKVFTNLSWIFRDSKRPSKKESQIETQAKIKEEGSSPHLEAETKSLHTTLLPFTKKPSNKWAKTIEQQLSITPNPFKRNIVEAS